MHKSKNTCVSCTVRCITDSCVLKCNFTCFYKNFSIYFLRMLYLRFSYVSINWVKLLYIGILKYPNDIRKFQKFVKYS